MSHTIAHRPHVHHFPLLPFLVLIAAVIIATLVIWAVNQPQTTLVISPSGTAGPVTFIQPAAPPVLESPVFRHALMRMEPTGAEYQAYKYGRLHQVDGTTLDPVGTTPFKTSTYEPYGNLR